jgi:hypothetical protein
MALFDLGGEGIIAIDGLPAPSFSVPSHTRVRKSSLSPEAYVAQLKRAEEETEEALAEGEVLDQTQSREPENIVADAKAAGYLAVERALTVNA